MLEEISWTGRVRNVEVLRRVKEERNIIHAIERMKVNWIGHVLRRNCLLKHTVERKIEVTVRQGRRRKQLLNDFKEASVYGKIERGSTRSHWVESSLWKRLWTCHKTD
jgi:hypothetical protein